MDALHPAVVRQRCVVEDTVVSILADLLLHPFPQPALVQRGHMSLLANEGLQSPVPICLLNPRVCSTTTV